MKFILYSLFGLLVLAIIPQASATIYPVEPSCQGIFDSNDGNTINAGSWVSYEWPTENRSYPIYEISGMPFSLQGLAGHKLSIVLSTQPVTPFNNASVLYNFTTVSFDILNVTISRSVFINWTIPVAGALSGWSDLNPTFNTWPNTPIVPAALNGGSPLYIGIYDWIGSFKLHEATSCVNTSPWYLSGLVQTGTLSPDCSPCTTPSSHGFNMQGSGEQSPGLISLNVTAELCDTTGLTCSSSYGPLSGISISVTGNTTLSGTTNASGVKQFTQYAFFGTVQIYPYADNYVGTAFNYEIPNANYSNVTVYLRRAQITVEPNPGNFTVPNPALFFLNKSTAETLYWAIFKVESSGTPTIRTEVIPILTPFEQARYPLQGPSFNSGAQNHTGQYFLAVVNASSQLQRIVPFRINYDATTITTMPTANTLVNTSIQQSLSLNILATLNEQVQAQNQANTESHILGFVDAMYSSPILIPNMFWLLIILGGIALAQIMFVTRRVQ